MPKIRNHRGTKKRFRVTSTGKVMRRHSMRSHLLVNKSAKRRRANRQAHPLAAADVKRVLRNAPTI
jgi:large subunit ribosomal protein L35